MARILIIIQLTVWLHTLSKSGFASHSPYRKQGLPGRGKLAFGRPKLAYGVMTVRLHTLSKYYHSCQTTRPPIDCDR